MNPAKILLFDIETTNLAADFAQLLCVGYKWWGQKTVHCPRIDRSRPNFRKAEKALLQDFLAVYETADVIVSYNGKMFDVPFLQAKALEHGLGVLPNPSHVDLYWTAKHGLRISRKSLQNLAYYLGVPHEKTPVEGRIWVDAMMGVPKALNYIVAHCKADVLVLEDVYKIMRPLVRQHPRVMGPLLGCCRFCGSQHLQRRGRYINKAKSEFQRVRCMDCQGWDSRRAAVLA